MAPLEICTFNITKRCDVDASLVPVQQCSTVNQNVCQSSILCEEERSETCSPVTIEKRHRQSCLKVPKEICSTTMVETCRIQPTSQLDLTKEQQCFSYLEPVCREVDVLVCSQQEADQEDICHSVRSQRCDVIAANVCEEEEREICDQVPVSTCKKVQRQRCIKRPEKICLEKTTKQCVIKQIEYTRFVEDNVCKMAEVEVCSQGSPACTISLHKISQQVEREECKPVNKRICVDQEIIKYRDEERCKSVDQKVCRRVSRLSCSVISSQ